jgi:hypothetical protein
VQLIRDAADAIHEAHRQGIIHRDPAPPFIPSRNDHRAALGKGCETSRRPLRDRRAVAPICLM